MMSISEGSEWLGEYFLLGLLMRRVTMSSMSCCAIVQSSAVGTQGLTWLIVVFLIVSSSSYVCRCRPCSVATLGWNSSQICIQSFLAARLLQMALYSAGVMTVW